MMFELFSTLSQFVSDVLDLRQYQHFHFLRPAWLLMLVPFFLVYRSLVRADDVLAPWRQSMSPAILRHLRITGTQGRKLSPRKLYVPIAILSTLVLAGPTWRQQPSPFLKDQSALVIALDVSATMNQNDLQPTRLVRAKDKITRLLERRGDAETALIAYAGSAHVAMPLTDDRTMVRHFLDVLDNKLVPVSGQRPQAVLAKAEQMLSLTATPGTLLLLSDGTNPGAIEAYRDFFATQPHQLIVWAIGDTDGDTTQWKPLQLDALQAMTQAAGGRLVRFSHADDDVDRVNRWIKSNLVVVDDDSQPWYDAGYPLLFLLAAFQVIWFRRGWSLQW